MDTFGKYRTNSTGWQRCMTMLLATDETETTSPGLTKKTKDATKRSFLMATVAAALALLPLSFYGAVQVLANVRTNAVGKGSVEIRGIIKDAFISQPINGQRVRTDLNHPVIWFADPADAAECFAPGPALQTSVDVDGEAGPSAFSSKNALPSAPLP